MTEKEKEVLEWNAKYVRSVINKECKSPKVYAKKHGLKISNIETILYKQGFWSKKTCLENIEHFPRVKRKPVSERKMAKIDHPLRNARLARNMTVEELSIATGVAESLIHRLENTNSAPREASRIALEDFLDIELPVSRKFLDDGDVYDIIVSMESTEFLAKRYNRDPNTIRGIRAGRSYRHVYDEVFKKKV